MAKTTKKPLKGTKSTKQEQQERLKQESDQAYAANKTAIDTALRRCNAHLKKLSPGVVREVTRRLFDYYVAHGMGTPSLR